MENQDWTLENILRLLSIFDECKGGGYTDDIWWRTDSQYAPVTFFVNCNDLFAWGCSDCETVLPSDLDDIQKAVNDCNKNKEDRLGVHGSLLWVARKRKLRPQKAYYKSFTEVEKILFDACGPKETQYGA